MAPTSPTVRVRITLIPTSQIGIARCDGIQGPCALSTVAGLAPVAPYRLDLRLSRCGAGYVLDLPSEGAVRKEAAIVARASPITDEEALLGVLDDAVDSLRGAGIPFLMIGGVASTVWGRDRGTTDIDVFVRPDAVPGVLDALAAHGFDTWTENEHWLHKARRDGVTVDIIFRTARDILLDDEMLRRASVGTFRGRRLPIAPPEDLLVMKASAAAEDTARYWYDALGILSKADLDWPYLITRARQHGARRTLSLLLFASSVDLVVPSEPMAELWAAVHDDGGMPR